jgi:twitching motility protein PilT
MRDPETISLALTAAETGHLVFSSVHTSGAAQSLNRILDAFPGSAQAQVRSQLGSSLKAVISQVLIPRADKRGKVAAREVLLVTPAIGSMIREGQVHLIPNAIFSGAAQGMCTLEQDLVRLCRFGLISQEDAMRYASDPQAVQRFLAGHAGKLALRPPGPRPMEQDLSP